MHAMCAPMLCNVCIYVLCMYVRMICSVMYVVYECYVMCVCCVMLRLYVILCTNVTHVCNYGMHVGMYVFYVLL